MHPVTHVEILEAILLIEQPRQRFGHWARSLAALDAEDAPKPAAIVAYYDPSSDQALIALQYAAGTANMRFVADIALLAEVGMVQPAELSEGDRVRFLADRLTRCTIRVTGQRATVAALSELVRRIKDGRTNKPAPTTVPPPQRSVEPRGDTSDPVMLVKAKGTRDDIERLDEKLLDDENRKTTQMPPLARPSHERTAMPALDRPATKRERPGRELAREDRHRTVPMPFDLAQKLIGESSMVRQLPEPPALPPPPPRVQQRIRTDVGTAPYLPTPSAQQLPNTIYARYLRCGRWVPVRVGALSLKGAALLSGALPRVDDRIDIAFAFGPHRALVKGVVGKVSSMREAAMTGASTFSLAFELDPTSRAQLTTLLVAARDAKITIKPPPPRATRRFPVEWQVALGTIKGAVKATALDVSTYGMFVQPAQPLELGTALTFSVVLDDASAPIAGRARVVRQIKEAEAKSCGLVPGYGIVIVSMSEADRMRWLGFLARIERRADKRVVIGADASRFAELQATLAGLGYAVTGGTDPGALVQLVSTDARPADAVLIDAGWLQNEASASLIENLFAQRNVPCLTTQGEAKRARLAIDQLLEVVV